MSCLRPSIAVVLSCCLFVPILPAQDDKPTLRQAPSASQPEAPAAAPIHVDVREVTLPVTVRDKHGKIVQNLTKDDFALEQDGKPQTISNLRRDTNLPLTLGLLVDTSMSMRDELSAEKTASQKFLDQMLTQQKDQAFLIHFDHEVELLQDLTASRDKLNSALGLLETARSEQRSQDSRDDDDRGQGEPRMRRHGGTQLYDAIYLASNEVLKKQSGRKAIVVLTDGQDRGSKETLNDAIEAAQRADTIIYAIYLKGEQEQRGFGNDRGMRRGGIGFPGGSPYPGGYPGGGGGYPGGRRGGGPSQEPRVDGKRILTDLASKTGGQMFEASKKETVDQIYAQIGEELRTQFILAYTPDKSITDTGYHRLNLTAKNKDYKVQTREGYYIQQEQTTAAK